MESDKLKICSSGEAILRIICFKSLLLMPSCPVDFLDFKVLTILSISCWSVGIKHIVF